MAVPCTTANFKLTSPIVIDASFTPSNPLTGSKFKSSVVGSSPVIE